MKVEIVLEEVRRVAMEFEVSEEELKALENSRNPFEHEMMDELPYGYTRYDYTVNDMEGRTLVDWEY